MEMSFIEIDYITNNASIAEKLRQDKLTSAGMTNEQDYFQLFPYKVDENECIFLYAVDCVFYGMGAKVILLVMQKLKNHTQKRFSPLL